METTFPQKIVLAIVFGFLTAGGIKYFEVFIEGADEAVNGEYRRDHLEVPE